MDFFKRKPKLNAITDVEVFEKDDKNFFQSLLGEISSGSQDVKETVIYFPDHKVVVRSASGIIKSAYDTSLGLDLDARLYWTKDLGIEESATNDLLKLTPPEVFNEYTTFVSTYPTAKDFLSSALEAYVLSVIQKTVENFASHERVRTEIIYEVTTTKLIEGLDFFDYTADSAESRTSKLVESEKYSLNSLSVARFEATEVTLSVESSDYLPVTDTERFVFTAAENKATLEEMKRLSSGFVWSEVLETLVELSEGLRVKVSFPGSDDSLPDLFDLEKVEESEESEDLQNTDDNGESELSQDYQDIANPFEDDEELEDKNSLLDAKPLEGIIVEMVNSPGEEYVFGSMIDEDDGSFMYEMLKDDDSNLFTVGTSDNIEVDVRRILKHESVSDRVKEEVIVYLRRNTSLETEVRSIEKSIADSRGRYNENVEVFEELKFQNNVAIASDDSEIGEEKLDSVEVIKEKQDISNISFFTVSKLEEDRYKVNLERRVILRKMSALISEMFGEGVQGVLHRIDLKLKGIESVTNVAFHAPEDDEDELVDPSFLNDLTSESVYAKSKEFTFADTPTFFILAAECGFSPFADATVS